MEFTTPVLNHHLFLDGPYQFPKRVHRNIVPIVTEVIDRLFSFAETSTGGIQHMVHGIHIDTFTGPRAILFQRRYNSGSRWMSIVILEDVCQMVNGGNVRYQSVLYNVTSIVLAIHRSSYGLDIHFLVTSEGCSHMYRATTTCPRRDNVSILGRRRACR